MKINRTNYEVYIIDYLDGNLSPQLQKELQEFLLLNPDIKQEFDGLNQVSLHADTQIFPDKDLLKKEIESSIQGISEFDYLCIADLEEDITIQEKHELQNQLTQNIEKQTQYNLYLKTKLSSENSTKFPNKHLLKKEVESLIQGLSEFDYLCIADVEGDITIQEKQDFKNQLSKNTEKQLIYNTYSKAKLSPENSIEFPNKQALKKRTLTLKPILYYSVSSIAAMFILFLGLKFNGFYSSGTNGIMASHLSNVLANNPNTKAKSSVKQMMIRNVQLKVKSSSENKVNSSIKTASKSNKAPKLEKTNEPISSPVYEEEIQLYNEIEEINNNATELTTTQDDKKYANNTVNKNEVSKTVKSNQSNSKFWNFVKIGVGNVKSLTGADIDVKHEADKNGKTKNFAVNLGKFSISHSKSK